MSLGTIGEYDLLERIGVGAESNIYRARDRRSGELVAIKDVVVEEPESYKYLNHVANEFQVLHELHRHMGGTVPCRGHIVRVFRLMKSGFLRKRKRCSMVMEYAAGRDLRRERRYPLAQLLDFFSQVAEAVGLVHKLGYVHADLKPENIIISPRGQATLVDFGFSCPLGSKAQSVRGTRDYMAPEQVYRGTITAQTDIYNFGATMYYLLTGRHVPALIAPANGGDAHFISGEDVDLAPVRQLNENVPLAVARLVEDCCQKETIHRPAGMAQVTEVLREASLGILTPEPSLAQE